MAKDETEEGITGQPIPKKKMSPAKRHKFEKERREERKKRNDPRVGDTFSQHRMTGSRGHGSEYQNSVREEVLSYLLDEGFASDKKSAEAIMGAMSEGWKQSIVEASEEDKVRLRNYEIKYYQKHGGMPTDPEKRKQLRDAARNLPPA